MIQINTEGPKEYMADNKSSIWNDGINQNSNLKSHSRTQQVNFVFSRHKCDWNFNCKVRMSTVAFSTSYKQSQSLRKNVKHCKNNYV